MTRKTPWVVLLTLAAFFAGCSSDDSVMGDFVSNSAPDTDVTGTPPVLGSATFTVGFNWSGADSDGEVVGFEWRISNNGFDGIIDPGDTLQAKLPWRFTTVMDSLFIVSADMDSFPSDVADSNQSIRNYRHWQTHTFFVRSVDNKGLRDPSPAQVSFTATTVAPIVNITLPPVVSSISCRGAARVMTFGWNGRDNDTLGGDPAFSRYLLIPASQGGGALCLTQQKFEEGGYITADDPRWSPWIPYDAPDGSGQRVTLPRQEVGDKFLFAVQCMDIAGAVTPDFRWNRNVRHVQISPSLFPELTVTERFLGAITGAGTNQLKQYPIPPGMDLQFSWIATAESYAGIVEAYRYGWDVSDPTNPTDPNWAVPWGNGPAWRRASNTFNEGTHRFTVQVRDNSGSISRVVFILTVVPIPQLQDQRPILVIDDWRDDPGTEALDTAWDNRWLAILNQRVLGFQPTDMLEASTDAQRVTFETLARYRNVIWFTNSSEGSFFHRRLAPENATTPRFNWLQVYQSSTGNVMMVGPGVMSNTVETDAWVFPMIFDVGANSPLGFGTQLAPSGVRENRGLSRYPYTGWCLEAVDQVRPAVGAIFGEHDREGTVIRYAPCDRLHVASVADEFKEAFPEAALAVRDLEPRAERQGTIPTPGYQINVEEFYNFNATKRTVQLFARNCQTPMFRWVSRRDYDEYLEDLDPDDNADYPSLVGNEAAICLPLNTESAAMNGAPTAMVSSVYSDFKRIPGASDFVWGFNPHSFELDDVTAAVHWILGDNWELNVVKR